MTACRSPVRGLTLVLLLLAHTDRLAAEPADSEPAKLVIAHYMTDMVPWTARGRLNRWIDPELADPEGSTAAIGGINQTIPLAPLHLKDADLSTAVDFEIRAARQLGIDGFQFYYPLGDNTRALSQTYNRIIGEFLRLSETRHQGFKISVCLSHPHSASATDQGQRIELWAPVIRELVEPKRDSVAWLRGPTGSILFYQWVGDALADGVRHLAQTPEQLRQVSAAYAALSQAVGTPIDFVYQVRRPQIDQPYLDALLGAFPALWGWTASEENPEFWDELARQCHARGVLYTQTVYPDYYTSKLYRKGAPGHDILSTERALQLGTGGVERHYRVTDLSGVQVGLYRKAISRRAHLINYATWNDFPEGHHLAPEQNHNFGPSLLLRHFKKRWQTGEAEIAVDQAIMFYKKYRHDLTPRFETSLKIKSRHQDLASEDRIELVTLLTAPAEGFLNGQALGEIPAGFQINSIPSEPGKVSVRLRRDGADVVNFTSPEPITENPLRTDRLTYSYSNRYWEEFDRLFGDK